MNSIDPDHELAALNALLAATPTDAEQLLPVLQQVQRQFGHVSTGAMRVIAQAFNLSRAEVYGVVSFYGDLREVPVGTHVVQLCMAEACQAAGARALAREAERLLGVAIGNSTADGLIHLEAAYCFGNCAIGPAMRVGDEIHGGVDASVLASQIMALRSGTRPRADRGSTIEREPSAEHESTARPHDASVVSPAAAALRVYVPNDSTARSVGADQVADAIARLRPDIEIVRNGSRGAYFLEPLVEVDSPEGRVGFGNVTSATVTQLFGASELPSAAHPLSLGMVEQHPWLRDQHRLTFARVGRIDPLSMSDYGAHDGWRGLARALTLSSQQIVDEVKNSGLRGRGGAAFPAGIKWQTVHDAPSATRYIVCNADEGDSGTFADRLLMDADPFQLIEGMTIAALAVGAERGFIYLRSEYPHTIDIMERALRIARQGGVLGPSVMGSPHRFDIALRIGGGAYICGEETALLESLEGKRGVVRAKPPLPALAGLFGQPTIVNNVLTLAAVTSVLADGAAHYAGYGLDRSKGTMPFQLGGNVLRGGLVELPFGLTLRELVERFGGGTASRRPIKAIQVGGPLGAYLPASQWDTPLAYESMAAIGAMLGHGGVVVFDDTVDMGEQAQFAMEFCAHESCGKCTPCRIGSTRGAEVIARIRRGQSPRANWQLLEELCETMELGSLCALGGLTPMPVRSVMAHFPGELLASAHDAARVEVLT